MDIYFAQQIDNSRLVRVADPRRRREQRALLIGCASLFVLLFAWTWQRYQLVELGYRMQAVKTQEANLEGWNRGLRLEVAALRDPRRIYSIATMQLGLQPAAPEQVSMLEPAPGAAAGATAMAQLNPPRRSGIAALSAVVPPNER